MHKTWRSENSKGRVSIDTTLMVGNHPVHPDREVEYLDKVPIIGEESLFKVAVGRKMALFQRKRPTFHITPLVTLT